MGFSRQLIGARPCPSYQIIHPLGACLCQVGADCGLIAGKACFPSIQKVGTKLIEQYLVLAPQLSYGRLNIIDSY